MATNVTDRISAGLRLFQSALAAVLRRDITERECHAGKRLNSKPPCGTVEFDQDERATILVREGTSPIHFMGHVTLRDLYRAESEALPEFKDGCMQLIRKVEAWAEIENGVWSSEQEEQVVRQFEQYACERMPGLQSLATGEGLSPVLKEVFEVFVPLEGGKSETQDEQNRA